MPEIPTLSQRIRYAFDNVMGRGPVALIGLLLVLTLALVLFIATVLVIGGVAPGDAGEPLDFIEAFWLAVVRTLDAGTFGADTGWRFRLIMLIDTLGGVFIVAALIGILSSGLEDRLGEMRKGRSLVVEEGHTLILGWSHKIFTVINELAIANESGRKPRIVIVAARDKVEMDDAIRERVPQIGKMKVICRTGNPIDPSEIQIGRPTAAKSIIILAPEADDPDTQVIKTIFALTGHSGAEAERHRLRIVAEIHDERNLQTAHIVGKGQVQSVLLGDIITRIAAQTCRQSGLSVVMTELLSFKGNEFYVYDNPALIGKTFWEAGRSVNTCVVCGILPESGELRLNPPPDARFEQGDRAIVIAQDDSLIRVSDTYGAIDESAICAPSPPSRSPERTLILGWSKRGPRLINELDTYSTPNSVIHVVTEDATAAETIARLCRNLTHSTATAREDDTTDRRTLDALDVPAYHHVILLCADNIPPQRADARAMITLAHLRDIAEKTGATYSITAEMLDVRDRDLVRVNRPDDFVVSDELTSLMVVQLSESSELAPVFRELFTVEGCEVYLKPATDYVVNGLQTTFETLAEAASRRLEVAIGYRLAAHAGDAGRGFGVVINPPKTKHVTFSARDKIIVLSDN
ncbi:MAG: potassium transporter TrkA [Thermoflexales bacterium]